MRMPIRSGSMPKALAVQAHAAPFYDRVVVLTFCREIRLCHGKSRKVHFHCFPQHTVSKVMPEHGAGCSVVVVLLRISMYVVLVLSST